jgi:hypothetical protein
VDGIHILREREGDWARFGEKLICVRYFVGDFIIAIDLTIIIYSKGFNKI